jgi:hypothetical protein
MLGGEVVRVEVEVAVELCNLSTSVIFELGNSR